MLALFGVFVWNLFSCFLTTRKRKESELKERFPKAGKGALLALVGRSAGFILEGGPREPCRDAVPLNGAPDSADQDGDGFRVGIAPGHSR